MPRSGKQFRTGGKVAAAGPVRIIAFDSEKEFRPYRPNEGAEPPMIPAPAIDALVARLAKMLDRIIAQWPAERRDALRERLRAVMAEPP